MTRAALLTTAGALAMMLAAPRAEGHGLRDARILSVGVGGSYVNFEGAKTGAPSAVVQYGRNTELLTLQGVFELGYRPATEAVHLRLTGELLGGEFLGITMGLGAVLGDEDPGGEMIFGLAANVPLPLNKRSAIKLGVTLGRFVRFEGAPARGGFFVGVRLLFRHFFGEV